jgi:hypothetical protein
MRWPPPAPERDYVVLDDRGAVHTVRATEPYQAIREVVYQLGLAGLTPQPPSGATRDLPRWTVRIASCGDSPCWAYVLRDGR